MLAGQPSHVLAVLSVVVADIHTLPVKLVMVRRSRPEQYHEPVLVKKGLGLRKLTERKLFGDGGGVGISPFTSSVADGLVLPKLTPHLFHEAHGL